MVMGLLILESEAREKGRRSHRDELGATHSGSRHGKCYAILGRHKVADSNIVIIHIIQFVTDLFWCHLTLDHYSPICLHIFLIVFILHVSS